MYSRYLLTLISAILLIESSFSQLVSTTLSQRPNEIVHIDLQLSENIQRHHTAQYRQMNRPYIRFGPSVVLRRGEIFNIAVHLRNSFNKTRDKIRLEFAFGSNPQLDKGTLVYLPLNDINQTTDNSIWNAKFTKLDKQLNVQINIPPNTPIGIWRFKISTKLANSKEIITYAVDEAIYLIFNAWCPDDSVYLAREDARQEYVLNEVGKIYIGSYSRPTGRKWTYGQFHESVLPSIMYLLDKTRLDVVGRADVVKVSRAVSAMVNSHDDNGLVVGNWSGNYGDGLAPWQWTGSPAIFDRYISNGFRSVKFGQCWVFGGMTTTVLRTLGIPARTISNFVSAHDTDLSLTVDKFFYDHGAPINGVNGDSIWNFHVWSDAWMLRQDLPSGYGGWQAIDATPQETSMGKYQTGPASLEAIRQGMVDFAYDVGFVFSEVNADLVNWRLDGRSTFGWRRDTVQTGHVGRKILTKIIGILDERTRFGVADAEDIVNQYKHPEGSKEERLAYARAIRSAGLKPVWKGDKIVSLTVLE